MDDEQRIIESLARAVDAWNWLMCSCAERSVLWFLEESLSYHGVGFNTMPSPELMEVLR